MKPEEGYGNTPENMDQKSRMALARSQKQPMTAEKLARYRESMAKARKYRFKPKRIRTPKQVTTTDMQSVVPPSVAP